MSNVEATKSDQAPSPVAAPKDLPEMEYRKLGNSGLRVSAISLGGWLTYGLNVDDEAGYACIKAAYDAGINFFDTAEGYAGGKNEIAIGNAIKHFGWKRNDLVISTKIYWGAANGDVKANNVGLSRKHIIEGLNLSLKRLQLEYVDVVYAHRPDRTVPIEETVRAFNRVIEDGKAFYWGTSEWNAEEITEAWRVADKLGLIGPIVEQPQYNLLTREKVEKEYLPLFQKFGYGTTVFSPLKLGILTGKYNGFVIPEGSRLATHNDEFTEGLKKKFDSPEWKEWIGKAKALEPIAQELGVSQTQLALAWILTNPNVSSAIIGATKPEQVFENVKALSVVPKLTKEILEKIEAAVGTKPVAEPKVYY